MLKIQILGGPGSGKTTLGAEISARFDLPFYEADVLGMKNGTQHTAWIRDAFAIISLPGWVTEGGALIWNDPILAHADYIVLLEVPWRTAAYRIVRRHIVKSLRGINPYPGIRSLISFLKNSRRYYLNQCHLDLIEAMNRCLEEQRTGTEPLDAERLLARLETYGVEIIRPPTAEFMRQYLEKYKQKLIVVRNNADRASLLDFLAQQR
jgi:adenylate kinase family enzyme